MLLIIIQKVPFLHKTNETPFLKSQRKEVPLSKKATLSILKKEFQRFGFSLQQYLQACLGQQSLFAPFYHRSVLLQTQHP